jgi:Small-conductance mechanosensitive channel
MRTSYPNRPGSIIAILFAVVLTLSSFVSAVRAEEGSLAPAATTDAAQSHSSQSTDDDVSTESDPQAAAASYAAHAAVAQARLDSLPAEIADEALRARVAERWKEALTQWQAASQAVEQFIRRKQTIDGSAARLQAIQGEIEALRTKAAATSADASHSLVDLETELRELDVNIPEWTKLLGQRVQRIESQAQRLSESRQAADEAQSRLAEKLPPIAENLPVELRAAIREARTAHSRADHEIVSGSEYFRNIQEPLAQLDAAERDLLSRRIEYGKTRREQLSTYITEKRRTESESLRRESESAAARFLGALPPSFREIAEENRELSATLDQVLEKEKERSTFLQTTNQYIHGLQSDYERIKERLESGGGGQALGSYLWAKRRSLQREAYRVSQNRDKLTANTQLYGLSLGSLDELRRRIPRLEQELAAFSDESADTVSPESRKDLLERARTLLDNHARLVSSLSDAVSRQAASLIDMETTNKELRRISGRYAALVDRYVLHLPGSPPLWRIPVVDTIHDAVGEMAGLNLWRNTLSALLQGMLRSPWLILILLISIAPTAVLRALAKQFKSFNFAARTPVAATPKGLLWRAGVVLVRSYPAPLFLFAIGAAIWSAASPGGDASAVGEALIAGVLPWLLINIWRHFCDAGGLFELYAKIPESLAARLRRRLTSVMYIGLPLWIATWFVQNRTDTPSFQMFGGIVSTLLAAIAVGFWWLRARPAVLLRKSGVEKSALWNTIHLIVMALGILWLVMSLLGYNYGALLVIAKAVSSGLILTSILVVAQYWYLRLARAREIQRARAILYYRFSEERRRERGERQDADKTVAAGKSARKVVPKVAEAAAAQDNDDDDLLLAHREEQDKLSAPAVAAAAVSIPPAVEKELGDSLDSARRLVWWLSTAVIVATLLLQWSDLFPIQEWLGKLTLFSRTDGGLTLLAVVRAVVGGGLCYVIAKPLGAWINLSFFGWNPTERGTRMATLSLVRYLMFGIGVIWAAQELGVAWSDAQWLVAALSVGLGFGLQEIILNFVSGIILLFERPVRVGDLVTIGGADGTITRINIRTTTIIDGDRRELIIPNKELVTGRVINWTLSDTITRMVIPVGVAYGTDPDLVQRLLLKAANSIAAILDDPAPSVYFVAMADSSLNFELRVYTARLEDRMPTQHTLRLNINRLFQKHNICIPFPQIDVHLYQEKGKE